MQLKTRANIAYRQALHPSINREATKKAHSELSHRAPLEAEPAHLIEGAADPMSRLSDDASKPRHKAARLPTKSEEAPLKT